MKGKNTSFQRANNIQYKSIVSELINPMISLLYSLLALLTFS